MNNDFKFLELKVIRLERGIITFKIVEQLFRKKRFFNGNNFYDSTNGIKIISLLKPEVKSDGFLFVRGVKLSSDDIELTTNLGFYLELLKAVKEYNISMNKEIYKYQFFMKHHL